MDRTLTEGFGETIGLFNALTGINLNKSQLMQFLGLTIGGWLESGYTFNLELPRDRSNRPAIFNDRANELLLDEAYLFFSRSVNTKGNRWDFGGRADFLFGTDTRFIQAVGLDDNIIGDETSRFYKFAIPQLYMKVYAPYGNASQ